MNAEIMSWVSQFYVSFFDFVITYLIAHTLISKRIKVTPMHVVYALLYTVLVTTGLHILDIWPARILYYLLMMLFVKKILLRSSWSDMLIIFLTWFIMVGIVQGLIIVGLSLFHPSRLVLGIIGQLLTAVAIFILCRTFKWHYLFHTIRSNIFLKAFLFIFAWVIVVAMSLNNLELDFLYILFATTTIILILTVIFPIVLKLYQVTNGIMSSDELKHDLWLTALEMIDEPDADSRYDVYAELAGRYGQDVSTFLEDKRVLDIKKAEAEVKKQKIEQLIQKRSENNDFTIYCNIAYMGECQHLTFEQIVRWLEQLLDRAVRTNKQNPIFVSLCALDDSFSLSVANEALRDDMLADVLNPLREEVTAMQANFSLEGYHQPAYACDYMEVSIEIKKEVRFNR